MAPGRHRESKRRMKWVEAEDLLESDVRSKDFWAVEGDYDNCRILQDVLDVLFNSIDGNRYEVDYWDNQNSTRLIIHCKICHKDLTSYDPFITHENGKLHRKNRQQIITPKDPNLMGTLKRRPHNEPRGIFPEGSLEEEIDTSSVTVLGVQFVYKEVINGQETFTCQLCQQDSNVTRIRSSRMFTHLTSNAHTKKYLAVKFGYTKNEFSEFDETARQYEEYEGKIHSQIIDFTKQMTPDTIGDNSAYYNSQRYGKSRSSKSSSRFKRSRSRSLSCPRSWRSRSPSCGYMSESSSSNSSSRSLSPRTPKSPSPDLSKPSLVDAAVTVNMSEDPRPISKEVDLLQEMEGIEMLLEDTDMQELLVQTLWVLNVKIEKYYHKTNAMFHGDSETYPLTSCTRKVKQKISELEIL